MAANVKSIKRMKFLKRFGLIGTVVSVFALTIILVVSFLPKGDSNFTVQIDGLNKDAHFEMSERLNGPSVSYLRAGSLERVYPTNAKRVESYLSSIEEKAGSQNLINEGDGSELALVYTVYLKNTSASEDQTVKYDVAVDSIKEPENEGAVPPIEYLRVLTQVSVVGEDDVENIYFGQRRSAAFMEQYPNNGLGEDEHDREPIMKKFVGNELTTDYSSNGNDGYCINFEDYQTGYIVSKADVSVPKGKILRFTFAVYFEGADLDCGGYEPVKSNILLSLHFGA